MSFIIKHNVNAFGKIISSLEKVNNDNLTNVECKLEKVEKEKLKQITIINKTFNEFKKKIDKKHKDLIEEFNNKYLHETKRFKKLEICLHNDQAQMGRIAIINEKLTAEFEKYTVRRY